MIKVKQNEIKACSVAENITGMTSEDLYNLERLENGFERIAISIGIYGMNGAIVRGNKTGKYYKVCARCTNLFIVA